MCCGMCSGLLLWIVFGSSVFGMFWYDMGCRKCLIVCVLMDVVCVLDVVGNGLLCIIVWLILMFVLKLLIRMWLVLCLSVGCSVVNSVVLLLVMCVVIVNWFLSDFSM